MQRFPRDEVELNLAPMLDVVLLLLCFFVLTARFGNVENPTGTIDLALPSAKSEQRLSPDALLIDLDADGQVAFKGDTFRLQGERLRRALEESAAQHEDLVIRADAATPHGRVIRLMDVANSLGYKRLRVATRGGGPDR